MGNLRQKYTGQEWSEMERKAREDLKNGKPTLDENQIIVYLGMRSLEELQQLKEALKPFTGLSGSTMRILNKHIDWKIKNNE